MKLKTLRVRVKDRHFPKLRRMARAVNLVWNYCNELSERSIRDHRGFLSGFELQKYTAGSSKELGLNAQTVQLVCQQYAHSRQQYKRNRLRWRKSAGTRRSLGWIPLNPQQTKWRDGSIQHNGTRFRIFDSHGLENYKFRQGTFSEDARGKWYFNVVVEVPEVDVTYCGDVVGIDLGCKDAVTTSDGEKLTGRWYRDLEPQLNAAQRAGKKKRVSAIHAKIKNRRKDALHKLSRSLVRTNAAIIVGDISAETLAQTSMSKSAYDAGWSMFRKMLEYKCDHAGVFFLTINESFTTQTCSHCGEMPPERPKGIAGLGIREWSCGKCGTTHDRDVNAAKNILRLGLETLVEGTPDLQEGRQLFSKAITAKGLPCPPQYRV